MTIFVDAAARCALVVSKSTEGPFDELESLICRRLLGGGGLDTDEALLDEVTQQHPGDTDGHLGQGRHLGHGTPVADLEDLRGGGSEDGRLCTSLEAQSRLHGQVDTGCRPACGDGVRPDEARAVSLVLRLDWRRHGRGPVSRPYRRGPEPRRYVPRGPPAGPSRSPPGRCRPPRS